MQPDDLAGQVNAVRAFSRFYTRRLGLLHEGLLGGPLSLSEGRLVYELAQRGQATASALGADLGLDSGYLSRLVRGLQERGLVVREPSPRDGRQFALSLTQAGREAFAAIDERSAREVGAMLAPLTARERRELAGALSEAERLLGGGAPEACALRAPRPGDLGFVVSRQTQLYAREYGWDESYEALACEIVAAFIRNFDPRRERCWLADRGGDIVGSVFLVRDSSEVAKLRLLYVDPSARGQGLGRRLVDECVATARDLGYARLTLWTNDVLVAARRIYQAAGFRLTAEERHHSFGHDLVGQNWELELR